MVRLRMTPKRRSDLLILLGVVLLSAGSALKFGISVGLIVAGASAVSSGLFLVANVEGASESISARPKRRRPRV